MKVVCVSDIHGKFKFKFPKGDVLVMAGDCLPNFSMRSKQQDSLLQGMWLEDHLVPLLQSFIAKEIYNHIVFVPGNHDRVFQDEEQKCRALFSRISRASLLIDEGTHIDGKLIWGSPWTPWFGGHWWAFNHPKIEHGAPEGIRRTLETWNLIPAKTDILITHGPPRRILDMCADGREVGCPYLREEIFQRIKPTAHIFGHIHEGAGMHEENGIKFINAAICNELYEPINPVRFFEC